MNAGATGSPGVQGPAGVSLMAEEFPLAEAWPAGQGTANSNPQPVVTPAVPASTIAIRNSTGIPVTVYVKGGALTDITVGGTSTGISAAAGVGSAHTIPLTPNQTIAITYTVAPTWVWIGT